MTRRVRLLVALAGVVGAASVVAPLDVTLLAQRQGREPAPAGEQAIPRTPAGRPDLSGLWSFVSATPLERPEALGDTAILGDEDLAAAQEQDRQNARDRPPAPGETGAYNRFWTDAGADRVERRTSLISDPPDGRLPPVRPEARESLRVLMMAEMAPGKPEDFTPWARCITGFNAGPPILPSAYNNNLFVAQTPETVALLTEMVHEVRAVPLSGTPPLPSHVRQWQGSSRGRWEGDTLVIETTNFRGDGVGALPLLGVGVGGQPRTGVLTDDNLHVVERISRPEFDVLRYEVTVEDPTLWTEPWTAVLFMQRSDEGIYEYACHEGNYGLENILAGTRAAER